MGLLRRSKGPEGPDDGLDPIDLDLELEAEELVAEDAEAVPLGPTGRPLHPVGAYFETAFRRYGINLGGYTLITALCGLLPLLAALANARMGADPQVQLAVFSLAFVLGHVLLVAFATVLVAGSSRERLGSILVACVATGVIGGLIVWQISVFAVILYPLIVLPPIIAASGDADGLHALADGARVAGRWFKRAYACVLGVVIVTAAVWFGFTVLLSPLQDDLQQQVAFAVTTLIVWPISALVFRNLYGDVTGRLVINASPKEDQYRRDLMKRRRARAKRNRRRIRRVTGE